MVVFAFSIQDQVEKYGAYVGLAAFLGLAVLTVLYFAQARELKRLRDWAGRAPERAREVEAQAVANAEAALTGPAPAPDRSGTVGPAQPVAAPSGNGKPAGTPAPIPIGPRPAVAVAAAAARAQATVVAEPPAPAEVAPADDDEPDEAEVAATPAADTGGPAEPPADITSQETALHDTLAEDDEEPEVTDEAKPEAEPEPEAEAEAEPEPAPSGNGVAAEPVIPRATPRPQPRPAPAAPLRANKPTRSVPSPRRAPVAPARAGGDSSRAGKITAITLGAIVAVAAVVFGATQLFGGDEPTPAPNVTQPPASSADAGSGGNGGGGDTTAADARPETVVAILNGTPTPGLAKSASDKLIAEGYSDESGMVRTGNNSDQQLQDSKVLYASGKRRQARDVAEILGISARPEEVDESTLSVANGVGGGGDSADVVAVLGLDQAP
jgi:hypothetical protein